MKQNYNRTLISFQALFNAQLRCETLKSPRF